MLIQKDLIEIRFFLSFGFERTTPRREIIFINYEYLLDTYNKECQKSEVSVTIRQNLLKPRLYSII